MQTVPPLSAFEQIERFDNGKYNAFGITYRVKDKMQIAYREGSSHVGDAGVIKIRTSSADFNTWSQPNTVYSDSLDCRNVGGGVTGTGRIILFFTKYNGKKSACISQGYIYSDDDGNAWSTYKIISNSGNGAFSPYGPMITIAGDTLLQSWYGSNSNIHSSYIIKSVDNGLTWSQPIATLSSASEQYTETSYAYTGNGNIIGLARGENTRFFTQVNSKDNGTTWVNIGLLTVDTTTGVKSPPWIVYNKGKLLCYYAQRTENKIRVISYDGNSWGNRIDLCSLTAGGYPSVAFTDRLGIGWFWDQITPANSNILLFKVSN